MIESSLILLVLLVAGGLFLASRLTIQKDRSNPAVEKLRLRESLAWHEARLKQARAANWDDQMIADITAQLTEVQVRIAEIAATEEGTARRVVA